MENMKLRLQLVLTLYGIILGTLVAVIAFLFLRLVNFLIYLVWDAGASLFGDPVFWPILICTLGGVFVGLSRKHIGPYPREMDEVMGEFHANGRVSYQGKLWRNLVAALIVLMFGASLGPEAALVSICAGLVTWVGDKLHFTYQQRDALIEFGIGALLSIIFASPLFGIASTQEGEANNISKKLHIQKIIIYFFSVSAGFLVFYYLLQLNDGPSPFANLGSATISWPELLLLIPLLLAGKYFGKVYGLFETGITFATRKIQSKPIMLAVSGGLILGVFAFFLPNMLYSGEHGVGEIAKEYDSMSIYLLLAIGFAKLFVTRICLGTGWRGGHIFPIIFASIAVGFALTKILPADPIFIVAIFATASCAVILKKPLAAAFLLALFFPFQLWLFIVVAAYLAVYKPKRVSAS
ncbi:hypothetical protein UE46_03955 [Listeria weihenstephanensis]|uniref:Chloride channel protein n=2 Tax=Listeria weihenstephanensis TaxID=1006155 RepID=A0A1S7FS43_9LIST|nr:hypothetical protein UE46_03955 [Listeria weihenstephanensis]